MVVKLLQCDEPNFFSASTKLLQIPLLVSYYSSVEEEQSETPHTILAACAGNSRGYHSEYGYSWFNNRDNDDAYYMFRSYNNCYYSSSEPVTDEEDEL